MITPNFDEYEYVRSAVSSSVHNSFPLLEFSIHDDKNGVRVYWETNSGYHDYVVDWRLDKEDIIGLYDAIRKSGAF